MKVLSQNKIIALVLLYGVMAKAQELVAFYKFDGALLDETVNSYHLTPSSGFIPVFVEGKDGEANTAISGFGVSNYLQTTKDLSISGNDERTFSAWVKVKGDDSELFALNGVIGHGENKVNGKFNLLILNCLNRSIPRRMSTIGSSSLNTGNWRHLVVTYANNKTTFYVDGEKETVSLGSDTFGTNGLNTAVSPLRIGSVIGLMETTTFQGAIDDVRVYDLALTADQVRNLYKGISLSFNELQFQNHQINAFPNPVKGLLNFKTKDVAFVSIYDASGRKIFVKKAVANNININTFTSGVYLVKFFNKENKLLGFSNIIKE